MKQNLSLILALLLILSLVLTGCTVQGSLPAPETEQLASSDPVSGPSQPTLPSDSEQSEPLSSEPVTAEPITDTTEPVQTNPADQREGFEDPMLRWQNGGYRDYLPDAPVDMVSFANMTYERPDMDRLFADFDSLIVAAKVDADTDMLLEAYYKVYDQYINFYTMDTLANIHHSLDTTDTYYSDEYDFCEEQAPNVEEKLEALYKAFAACSAREDLEAAYFGADYFDYYDDYEVYTNETYLRLAQEEEAVMAEYRALTAEPTIEYNGVEQSFWDLLETDSYYEYIQILQAYYDKYNPLIGDLYIQLIGIRKQMAEALGYESYADYCYENTYSRDYTPEEGRVFINGIETYIVPVAEAVSDNYSLSSMSHKNNISQDKTEAMVKSAAENIGGYVADAYHFMEAYGLYDITMAAEKQDSSFQTYIYNYEAPFVFVNSGGTSRDYTTFAHEFGHFTDAYYNYSADEDLETAETFSQSMEFLALTYTDKLTTKERSNLIKLQLVDKIDTFTSQAAYARFEDEVYALSEEELTVEKINEIFLQCCKDFNNYDYGFDFYYSQYWIDVIHFFEVPYYVISYCVSADTALEVYRLEAETSGAGVDAYFRLLNRPYDAGVQQVMEAAGLKNPFEEGALDETSAFLREQLGLN